MGAVKASGGRWGNRWGPRGGSWDCRVEFEQLLSFSAPQLPRHAFYLPQICRPTILTYFQLRLHAVFLFSASRGQGVGSNRSRGHLLSNCCPMQFIFTVTASHAVHLFSAGWGQDFGGTRSGDHLWAGAHPHVPTGGWRLGGSCQQLRDCKMRVHETHMHFKHSRCMSTCTSEHVCAGCVTQHAVSIAGSDQLS